MRKLFPIVAALAMIVAAFPSSPGYAQTKVNSPEYGASVFPIGNPNTADRDLTLMKNAGLGWARIAVPWRSIENGAKNNIDWTALDAALEKANAAGIKVMARVDHQPDWTRPDKVENGPPADLYDYADFVSVMARRYRANGPRPWLQAIQIWNEVNLNREWGGATINRRQAVDYMSMLRQSYELIKAADPTKIVVSAGLSPTGTNDGTAQPDDVYLRWLYENGLKDYSDVVGMHGNSFGLPPEVEINSDPSRPHASFYFRRVEQLRAIMDEFGDSGKQVWLLEFGYTTDNVNPEYAWHAVSPEQQADYIVRAFKYAKDKWSPWIGVMFVWTIADPNWSATQEQTFWAITKPDGSTRPAYDAISNARKNGTLP
ncbi:MAG: cellulase family glycosylhydrolase [Chloroflexota bacterium]